MTSSDVSIPSQAQAIADAIRQRRRFLTPGSGYQPGNARMFPNGN